MTLDGVIQMFVQLFEIKEDLAFRLFDVNVGEEVLSFTHAAEGRDAVRDTGRYPETPRRLVGTVIERLEPR